MPTHSLPRNLPPPLAAILSEEKNAVAVLRSGNRVYWARGPGNSPAPHVPETPVSRLVQGLYAAYPGGAHKLVRNRIFLNYPLTPYCAGVIRVAAKRLTPSLPTADFWNDVTGTEEVSSILPTTPIALADVTWSLAQAKTACAAEAAALQTPKGNRYETDRPIAAVILDPQGRVLGKATNAHSSNRSLHAEIGAIHQAWIRTGGRLPAGATVITTLKPCRMCANLIWWFSEDRTRIKVRYRDFDPGPHGRSTLLDLGSPDRLRWASTAEQTQAIQYAWSSDPC